MARRCRDQRSPSARQQSVQQASCARSVRATKRTVRALFMRQACDNSLCCVLFGLLCMDTIESLFMDTVHRQC